MSVEAVVKMLLDSPDFQREWNAVADAFDAWLMSKFIEPLNAADRT